MWSSGNPELINAMSVARRQDLGVSQENLAGHCELDGPYISLLEVGANNRRSAFPPQRQELSRCD